MLYRLQNISNKQLSLEVLVPYVLPEGTPQWKAKRLRALMSVQKHLLAPGACVDLEYSSLAECMAQPQIGAQVDAARLRVTLVPGQAPDPVEVEYKPEPKKEEKKEKSPVSEEKEEEPEKVPEKAKKEEPKKEAPKKRGRPPKKKDDK